MRKSVLVLVISFIFLLAKTSLAIDPPTTPGNPSGPLPADVAITLAHCIGANPANPVAAAAQCLLLLGILNRDPSTVALQLGYPTAPVAAPSVPAVAVPAAIIGGAAAVGFGAALNPEPPPPFRPTGG